MKRSKMLQIITELIYMDDKFEDTEIEIAENLASDILFVIERAGMLPPAYEVNCCPEPFKGTDLESSYISRIPCWEPETCGTCEEHCANDWCVTKEKE